MTHRRRSPSGRGALQVLSLLAAGAMLFVLPAAAFGQDTGKEETEEAAEKEFSDWYINGSLDLRYETRWNDDDDDTDITQTLSLSFGERREQTLSGYISARFYRDLDGEERPADPFITIGDLHGQAHVLLNAAYLDWRPGGPLEVIRVGRQWLAEIPEVIRMDGLRLETEPLEDTLSSRLILFGGVTEHFEESSRGGDRVYGGGFELRPLELTRLGVFYARLRDEYEQELGPPPLGEDVYNDDLISVELNQGFFERTVNFYGLYTNLNGDSRESRGRLSYNSEDGRTTIGLNYRVLMSTQESLSTELDPYTSILRAYEPYHEIELDFFRDLSDHLGVQGGAQVRRLDDEDDEGTFNREFERYYLSGVIKKLPFEGSTITLTGDFYDSNEDRFWVAEGSFGQRVADSLEVTVGSSYALYDEDRFTFEERSHVRTGLVRVEYEIVKDLEAMVGYEAQRDDEDTTHIVEAGMVFRF